MANLVFGGKAVSFAYSSSYGAYVHEITSADSVFTLVEGNTYTVLWNGEPFVCIGQTASLNGLGGVSIGNVDKATQVGDTGEPFLIVHVTNYNDGTTSTDMNQNLLVLLAGDATHEVYIYEGELEEQNGYLMKDQALEFAPIGGASTIYESDLDEQKPEPILTEIYSVIWDDVIYKCEAKLRETDYYTSVVLGNVRVLGDLAEDTGEPFVYEFRAVNDDNIYATFYTRETADTHVVSIYAGVLDFANIVLLDRNGNSVTYDGIKTVSFKTDDGKTATYTFSSISSN